MAKNYRSQLTGCFGDPIDENPTGVMEEAAYHACGLDYRYITMKVKAEDLKAGIAGIRAMNFRGLNRTIPHKVAVIPYLDELSEQARIIGAVNVIINENGKLIGDNTDGRGFLKSLTDIGFDPKGKTVTLLGAGGAARAVAVELALAGAKKINIINRSEKRGREVAELTAERTPALTEYLPWTTAGSAEGPAAIPKDTDVLVQCTNIGLYPDVTGLPDIDYSSVMPDMLCADVVFNRPDTPFLQRAHECGARTIQGLDMLVNQGALNFEMWTGCKAPVDVMIRKLREEFGL